MYFMTFWAQRDKSDESHLFRGVHSRGNVLLCEIKDGDCEITIPDGHKEYDPVRIEPDKDHFLWEWMKDIPSVRDLSSEDDDEDEDDDKSVYKDEDEE